MSGPCGWTVSPTCPEWQDATEADRDAAAAIAVDLLWKHTGRVFGVCPTIIRPCFQAPERSSTYRGRSHQGRFVGSWWPGLISGSMVSGSCGCGSGCDCLGPAEVSLPGPVDSITEITIDGEVLDSGMYRLRSHRWLLRTDGQPWPQQQNMLVADDAEGSFVVRYMRGLPLPEAGEIAVSDLACEFLKARQGGECLIPNRAMSIARQGVDIQLLDPAILFDGGYTGIETVDQWVAATNPHKLRSQPMVMSPDTRRR